MIITYKQYELLAEIKLGKREMDPLFAELVQWIRTSFEIPVIGFVCDEYSEPERCTILRMFVETMDDVRALAVDPQNWHLDFIHREEILQKFMNLVQEHKRENEYYLGNIRAIVWNFDDLAKEAAYQEAASQIEEHIKTCFEDAPIHNVYTMFGLNIFYHTDEQLAECRHNGISNRIKADYYYILKKHDVFDLFTADDIECTFDSHENIEKNYQGNYFFYFK